MGAALIIDAHIFIAAPYRKLPGTERVAGDTIQLDCLPGLHPAHVAVRICISLRKEWFWKVHWAGAPSSLCFHLLLAFINVCDI